jgi:hypothetical protein
MSRTCGNRSRHHNLLKNNDLATVCSLCDLCGTIITHLKNNG